MKITFLGVGSAFAKKNARSSLLVENGKTRLMVDCGATAPAAVLDYGLSLKDITHVFITHLHADHIGGLEELSFIVRFNHKYRPKLVSTPPLLERLWDNSLRGGLEFIEETPNNAEPQSLEKYFELFPVSPEKWISLDGNEPLEIQLHPTDHVLGLETYSVEIRNPENPEKHILFSGDTRINPPLLKEKVETCKYIFHDCQLFDSGEDNKFGVHASYNDLLKLPENIRNKTWIYHYGDTVLPDACADGFQGFLQHLQSFEI